MLRSGKLSLILFSWEEQLEADPMAEKLLDFTGQYCKVIIKHKWTSKHGDEW